MSKSSQQIFGLHNLYCPAEEAEVDIVAVHGLNGDALQTWTTERNQVCWLSDPSLLPKYLKRARILTWGYNANIHDLAGRTTSPDRILQHAQTLVAQLKGDRELEGATGRPIIFICHSLGGIIVKRALAYAATRTGPNVVLDHSIYTCTFGILFFGTPHYGSSKARLLGSLEKLASMSIPKKVLRTESNLMRALEEESETLQNINDQFAPMMHRFRIFFFWEQEATDLKYTKDIIVHQASAAPILDNTERSGIAADHRGMCRFDKSSSQAFRTVAEALQRYSREAPQVVGARVAREAAIIADQRQQEAMELLRGTQQPSSEVIRTFPSGEVRSGIRQAPGISWYSRMGSNLETERVPGYAGNGVLV